MAFQDYTITLAVVHLTSDRATSCREKRASQIKQILEYTKTAQHCFLVGDMNFGDGGENDSVDWGGHKDAWKELRPNDPGYTFDPELNALAKITSLSGSCLC